MFGSLQQRLVALWQDQLHRNSFFLMASTAVMAGVGFFFWMIASRFYSVTEVGLASSLISMSGLLMTMATCGLPMMLMRFLPTSTNKSQKVSTALTLSLLVAVSVASGFWLLSKWLVPELHQLIATPVTAGLFVAGIVFLTWQSIGESVLTSLQGTQWVLADSSSQSVTKVALSLVLRQMGTLGLWGSHFLGIGVSLILILVVLIRIYGLKLSLRIETEVLHEVGKYSLGSYIVGLMSIFPVQVLPTLVTRSLGAASAAHFFLALMIVNLLIIIPQANNQTLLTAAAAQPSRFKALTIRSLKMQLLLLSIGVAGLWLLGRVVLPFFGSEYVEIRNTVLRILSLGVLPVLITTPLVTRLRLLKKLRSLVIVSFLGTLAILVSAQVGSQFGLQGVAWGYVAGLFLTMGLYLLDWQGQRWSRRAAV